MKVSLTLSWILVIGIIQTDLVFAAEAETFGDRLFAGSLTIANKSLHSRFISEMIAGTLPEEVFQKFLYQDNLYLSKYARAFAVLGAKAGRTDELTWLLNQSINYLHEHGPGANAALEEEVFERDAQPVTVAYTSFFLQSVWSDDPILGYASVLPCQRLYDWLFSTIKATKHIADDNPYKAFIDQYADPANHGTTEALEKYLERYAAEVTSKEMTQRAQYHYNTAMKYESEFWGQAFSAPALPPSYSWYSLSTGTDESKLNVHFRKPFNRRVLRDDGSVVSV